MCFCLIGDLHIGSRVFFFQAEDGIRDLVRSRGLGDVYKRQFDIWTGNIPEFVSQMYCNSLYIFLEFRNLLKNVIVKPCLLYTSDAADERSSVDLGGRRIIKKKKNINIVSSLTIQTSNQNNNVEYSMQ